MLIEGWIFIKYTFKQFNSINTVLNLYNSLDKSVIMYCVIVWNKIEKVQYKFQRFMAFKMNKPMNYTNQNYSIILFDTNIITLEEARFRNGLIFLDKIINDHINCHQIKSQIEFYKHYNVLRKTITIFNINTKTYYFSIIKKSISNI